MNLEILINRLGKSMIVLDAKPSLNQPRNGEMMGSEMKEMLDIFFYGIILTALLFVAYYANKFDKEWTARVVIEQMFKDAK